MDQLFSGRTQLTGALQPLIEAAEARLDLDAEKRTRTIIRVDAGGGSLEQVNWVLERGYQFHGRDYSAWRAEDLSRAVSQWVSDPRYPEREVGWVEVEAWDYVVPLRRIVVRGRKTNGSWGYGVLLSSLAPEVVLALTGLPAETIHDPVAVLLAYVSLYDQRSGTMEISLKGDKQGLGITRRNKKRFEAQQMLTGLALLAHNVLVWAREWLAATAPHVRQYGIHRLVRDVLGISGRMEVDRNGSPTRIRLNRADRFAQRLLVAFQALVCRELLVVTLGET